MHHGSETGMVAGAQSWERTSTKSKGEAEKVNSKCLGIFNLKAVRRDILSPARMLHLNLPKQNHQLGTRADEKHSHSNCHS